MEVRILNPCQDMSTKRYPGIDNESECNLIRFGGDLCQNRQQPGSKEVIFSDWIFLGDLPKQCKRNTLAQSADFLGSMYQEWF